ncbi:hypothetical protein MWU49_09045 [Alcanivorax sp. S6407]|uniref:sialate O-acetylesterase n=1 Tax=Alcanivorax sp. S6407 TaxID=2926424 RepID=UPI001FF40F35|nr:sialate O-acetylesterase [Alcanivorax sp. S6407]MCK0153848.1 hypothetical protein [Alcanivorax sp. S6407]
MSYDTGNPVPSKDPRDLVDNAENMDEAVNGTGDSWTDRLGNSRPTLKRLEDDYPQAGVDADRAEAALADTLVAQGETEDARDDAVAAQAGAELAEANAGVSASAAATSAGDAQTYADAAAAAPSIYADTTAGLAATSVDDYFYVPSGVSGELLILYRHDSGPTATEVGRAPSSARISSLRDADIDIASSFTGVMNGYGIDDDGVPVASPLRFANGGREVRWWDAIVRPSLFQDILGLVPVTAVEQKVGFIRDLSGHGDHLAAPTDSARMTYRIDERGVPYLAVTAYGQRLVSAPGVTYSFPTSIVAAVQNGCWFGMHEGATSYGMYLKQGSSFRGFSQLTNAASGVNGTTSALGSVSDDLPFVIAGRYIEGQMTNSINGSPETSSAFSPETAVAPAGTRYTVGGPYSTVGDRFYGGAIITGGDMQEAGIRRVSEFFKVRTGSRHLEQLEYDVFMCGGQSNCSGQGDSLTSTSVSFGEGAEYQQGGVFKALADPTRHYATNVAGNVSDTGSAWPAFANKYYELTGRIALIVGGGVSGLGINSWAGSDLYRNQMVDMYLEAKALVEGRGGKINNVAMCYLGGETDATSGIAKATVKANMMTVIDAVRVRADIADMPAYLFSIDRTTDSGQDAAFAEVRDALSEVASENADVHLVMPYQDFVGQGKLVDSVHWDQSALNEAGEIAATNVAGLI